MNWMTCAAIGGAVLMGSETMSAGSGLEEEARGLEGGEVQQTNGKVDFYFSGNYEHQFKSQIDNGGNFTLDSFGFDLSAAMSLDANLKLNVQLGYMLDVYEFDGDVEFPGGDEAWETIHTASLGAVLEWGMDDDLTLFGGPMVQSARESGADFGESISGGGVLGFKYRISDDLTAGLGFGIFSQLEDDIKAYPIFVVDWRFSDEFRLSSKAGAGAFGRAGVEVIWDMTEDVEVALGGGYQLKRFRLDDDVVAPDGVGEVSSIPAWLRANYRVSNDVNVGAMVGFHFSGEVALENSSGDDLTSEDYDTTPFLSAYFSIHF